jgi:hypothetical protein
VKDHDVAFHENWLGLAQPMEGMLFSVPVLADARIAPELCRLDGRRGLSLGFAMKRRATKLPRRVKDLQWADHVKIAYRAIR